MHITEPAELSRLHGLSGSTPISRDDFDRHRPDLHVALVVIGRASEVLAARCSLWWTGCASVPGDTAGYVGHFSAVTAEAAHVLLNHACGRLAARGCTLAVGPVDGSTWHRYRFVVDRGNEPPFFLEPDNPDDYPTYFVSAGFTQYADFYSALNDDLSRRDDRIESTERRLQERGVRLRMLDFTRPIEDLRRIYRIAAASFSSSLLYTPLEEDTFLEMYRPLIAMLRPETVLLAEQNGQDVGFLFAVPDIYRQLGGRSMAAATQASPASAEAPTQRGKCDTIIIKSLAVLPDCMRAGLGGLLVDRCQTTARGLGFTRCIHALMHETNASRRISGHYARTMRRYALFARKLSPAVSNEE